MDKKVRFKVIINWYGENLQFYTCSKGEKEALKNVIRQLSKKLERRVGMIRNYVLDSAHRRWEIVK